MASGNAKGSAEQAFQQQNADELQAQGQRAKVIAAQSASRPLPVPAPLSIPPGVSPQMKDFLTLRDQIMRTQIALWNQDVAATAEQRSADLRQWEQQNAELCNSCGSSAGIYLRRKQPRRDQTRISI